MYVNFKFENDLIMDTLYFYLLSDEANKINLLSLKFRRKFSKELNSVVYELNVHSYLADYLRKRSLNQIDMESLMLALLLKSKLTGDLLSFNSKNIRTKLRVTEDKRIEMISEGKVKEIINNSNIYKYLSNLNLVKEELLIFGYSEFRKSINKEIRKIVNKIVDHYYNDIFLS